MIEKVKEYFIKISNDYYKKEGYDYWNSHVKHVVEFAKKLAIECNADLEIVEISAILHDIAKPLEERVNESHNVVGSEIAEKFLVELNFETSKIEKIKKCILNHSGIVECEKLSKEEWCVRNADVLSILKNVTIFYFLAYNEYSLSYEEGRQFVKSIIEDKIKNLNIDVYQRYKFEFNIILESI